MTFLTGKGLGKAVPFFSRERCDAKRKPVLSPSLSFTHLLCFSQAMMLQLSGKLMHKRNHRPNKESVATRNRRPKRLSLLDLNERGERRRKVSRDSFERREGADGDGERTLVVPRMRPVRRAAMRPAFCPATACREMVEAFPICWWFPPPWGWSTGFMATPRVWRKSEQKRSQRTEEAKRRSSRKETRFRRHSPWATSSSSP